MKATSAAVKVFISAIHVIAGVLSQKTCGTPEISPRSDLTRVKGGNDAVAGSWPWQVRLGKRMGNGINWHCGGSIISDIYVITAAHCLEGGLNIPYVVRVGDHDSRIVDKGQEDYTVLRIGMHGSYGGQQSNYANDIAILRLSRPITFRSQVSPVCIPQSLVEEPANGRVCYVTGFGQTGPSYTSYKTMLQQGTVQWLGRQVCNSAQYWGGMVSSTQMCAGVQTGEIDACQGDSGGPLVCQDNLTKRWILQGIVSYGPLNGCGVARKPAVYTKVTSFIGWIKSTTGNTV